MQTVIDGKSVCILKKQNLLISIVSIYIQTNISHFSNKTSKKFNMANMCNVKDVL